MELPEHTTGFAVALAAGVLLGIERERRKGDGANRGAAGLRTFALTALLGCLAAALHTSVALAIAGSFIAGAALLSYALTSREDPGLTTEVALVVAFLLGALALEEPPLAAGLAVVVTAVLWAREALHRFVRETMTEQELRDLLLFAAAAVVIWPLLPDADYGPYGALNPFRIWRLVVLVLGIGGAGYIAIRALGPARGLPLAGLAGGFVSSSATIGSLASLARRQPDLLAPALSGALLSTVATFALLAVAVGATSPGTLRELTPALLGAGLASLAAAALALRGLRAAGQAPPPPPRRAFDPLAAGVFAALVTGVLVVSATLNDLFGEAGLVLAAGAAGFADVHAAAISVAALVASGELSAGAALAPILIAISTNSLTKAIAARASGSPPFARRVWAGLLAVTLGAWLGAAAGTVLGVP